jgi:hypothetical protein
MNGFHLHLITALIVVLFIGCGGGLGPDSQDKPEANDNPSTTSASISRPLTGCLFIGDKGSYINLFTGITLSLTNKDALISPSVDGTEYVSLVKDAKMKEGYDCLGFMVDIERIEIHDTFTRLINDSFEVYEDIWGEIKLSLNHQVIAAQWASKKRCPTSDVDSLVTLFSRTDEILVW